MERLDSTPDMERLDSTQLGNKIMRLFFCDKLLGTSFYRIFMLLLLGIHPVVSDSDMHVVAVFTHEDCSMGEHVSQLESDSMATIGKATMLSMFTNNRSHVEFRKHNICSEAEALGKLIDVFRDSNSSAVIGPALHTSLCDSMASLAEEHHKPVLSYYCIGDIHGDHTQHTYHKTASILMPMKQPSMLRSIPTAAVTAHILTNTFTHFRYKRFAIYFTGDHPCWDLAHSVLTSLSTEGFQLMHFIQLDTVLHRNNTLDILNQLKSNTKGMSIMYIYFLYLICLMFLKVILLYVFSIQRK